MALIPAAIMGVLVLVLVLGSFLTIAIFLIISKAYNFKVLIYEQTGGGIKCYYKKAKRVENNQGNQLRFFLSKVVLPLPTGNYTFLIGKNNYHLSLYKDKNANYHPIPLRFNESGNPILMPDDSDMRFWKTIMDEQTNIVYAEGGFWEKYGGIVTLGVVCATALLILIVYGKFYFDGINQVAQPLTNSLTGVEKLLNSSLSRPIL